jgi:hypothetical protein
MTMLAVLTVITLALVMLLVAAARTAASAVTRPVTRSFRCPFREADVTVDFREEVWSGRPVDVVACTAFASATAITCGKPCLTRLRLPRQPALGES